MHQHSRTDMPEDDTDLFRPTFEQAATGMAHAKLDGHFLRVNTRLCEMLGYPREDLLERRLQDITWDEDLPADQALMARLTAGQIPHYRLEKRFRTQNGEPLWCALTVSLARAADGTTDYFIKVIEDISARKAAEATSAKAFRLYRTLSETNQMIVRRPDRSQLFQAICDIAVRFGGFRLAWVGLVAADGMSVEVAASSGGRDETTGDGYIDGIHVSTDASRPEGLGPTGRAIRENRPLVINDLLAAAITAPWQERARRFQLRASAAMPLREHDQVIGAFNVYADEAGFFDDDVVDLLREMAGDISHALDNRALDDELIRREREYRTLFEQAPYGIVVADAAGDLIDLNGHAERVFGLQRPQWIGRSLRALLADSEQERATSALDHLADGQPHRGEWRIRRHDGQEALTRVVGSQLQDGRLQFFVRDISALRRLEQFDQGSTLILDALARGESQTAVLTRLVRHLEALIPGALASVVRLDRSSQRIIESIAPSLPEAFNRALVGATIGPAAGSCGTAAYRGERVIVADINTSPLWQNYRELAALGGVRACWSEPIRSGKRILGTFALYDRTIRAPTEQDIAALTRAAHLVAITIERGELEADLRAALERQRQLVDDAPVGLALCRMDGSLIEVNPAFARMIGRSVEEARHLTYWEITPETYAAAEQAQLQALATTGRYGPYEKAYRHADGRLVPVRLNGRLLTVDGEACIWSAAVDLSEQRRVEADRATLASRVSGILACMSDGFVMLSPDWRYLYVNEQASRMIGRTSFELLGQNVWHCFPTTVGTPIHTACLAALDSGTSSTVDHFDATRGRWYENRIHGNSEGVSIYFRDITESKRHEQVLREANERLQALSSRLLSVQESERQRLSRELHDQIGQALTALKITLHRAARHCTIPDLHTQLEAAAAVADSTLDQVRTMSLDLRPPQLDDLGLPAALRWLVEHQAALAGCRSCFEDQDTPRGLPDAVAITAYRIAQEAITNALRHARPTLIQLGTRIVAELPLSPPPRSPRHDSSHPTRRRPHLGSRRYPKPAQRSAGRHRGRRSCQRSRSDRMRTSVPA